MTTTRMPSCSIMGAFVCLLLMCCTNMAAAWVTDPSTGVHAGQRRMAGATGSSSTTPTMVRTLVSPPVSSLGHDRRRYEYQGSTTRSALSAISVPWPSSHPSNATTATSPLPHTTTRRRFDRSASTIEATTQPCILTLYGQRYNLTAWANAHPGGVRILHKFHGQSSEATTRAFEAAHHSQAAVAMLQDFWIGPAVAEAVAIDAGNSTVSSDTAAPSRLLSRHGRRPRWMQKLFTREDPIGVHKYLGVFCLVHFIVRFGQMLLPGGDPAAGFGTRLGRGPHLAPLLCLLPHALLSLSSLIFHTVPKERVVGKPMIWQEYRIHNIAFGLRSVLCTTLAWLGVVHGHAAPWRRIAVVGSCAVALAAQVVADWGTANFRANTAESTTATMPYWPDCSVTTQKRFKIFYAYSQFMATLACIAVCNPAWPLSVLLAIQCASLFMTLVRKGILTAKGYHYLYTLTLILPYGVGWRSNAWMQPWSFPAMMVAGAVLFTLRAHFRMSKYMLWIPIYLVRILLMDTAWMPHDVW